MPQFYFHYTSRRNAQRIIPLRTLVPTRPGQRLWLTEDLYTSGVDAVKNLSIPSGSAEVVCVIPAIDIENRVQLSLRRVVDPAIWDTTGDNTGGGSEYSTTDDIDVTHATWMELSSP